MHIAVKSFCEHCLELIAVNDVHGRFFDTPNYSSGARVSLAQVSAFLRERRDAAGSENILVFDCGDNLQGDIAASWSNRKVRDEGASHIYPRVAEYMGYDAVVFGNHDIEAGHGVYDRVREDLEGRGIPVLGANVLESGSGSCYFKPYTIIERCGVRVAVIGMTNPCIAHWVPIDLREGMEFTPILHTAQEIVDEIRNGNLADVVVMLLHSGLGEMDSILSGGRDTFSENQALALAMDLDGVDVIFAGHDHRSGCLKVGDTVVLSAESHANGVQRVVVKLKMEGEKVVGKHIEGEIVRMDGLCADNEYLAHFGEDIREIVEYMDEPVGEIRQVLDARRALCGMDAYVGLLHSVQLEVSGADISFASPYMYDTVLGCGVLSRRDVFRMYSAENSLFKVRMSGKQIKDYLEYSYDRWICTVAEDGGNLLQLCSTELDGVRFWWPKNFTYNFDSAAGLRYEVDITCEYGNRVKIISFWNGEPFDEGKGYAVALSSYRTSGGGGLFDKGAGISPDTELEDVILARYTFIRDLLEEYLHSGRTIDCGRCGQWKFVPEEKAAYLLAEDMRLLFGGEAPCI